MAWAWYPRYPGDYKRDTSHLSLAEHGAYALLMDYYYSKGPIPVNGGSAQRSLDTSHDDRVMRICSAFDAAEKQAVASVLDQFFTIKEGCYHNKRADEILEGRAEISEKRKAAVAAREEKKRQRDKKKRSSDTSSDISHDDTTTTTTKDSISDTKVSSCKPDDVTYLLRDGRFFSYDEVVDWIWTNFPRVGRAIRGKDLLSNQLKATLRKEGENAEDWTNCIRDIAAAVIQYRKYCESTGEKQPDPHRWIKNGGWKDEYGYREVQTARPVGQQAGGKGNPANALATALSDQSRRSSS